MYILNVSYTQPKAAVEPHVAAHSAWVKQHLERGVFLAAGPKKNGGGGIILAKSMPEAELQRLLAADAYVQANVAGYDVAEFECRLTGAELGMLSGA